MNHLTPAEDFRARLNRMTRPQLVEAMLVLRKHDEEATDRALAFAAMPVTAGHPAPIDAPCPSVSPWGTHCTSTVAAHEADPRIAHTDSNGDKWFDDPAQDLSRVSASRPGPRNAFARDFGATIAEGGAA